MFSIDIDFSGMAGYLGVIKGVTNKSHLYASTVVDAATDRAKMEIGVAADAISATRGPSDLTHVYEPGLAGNPGARLFDVRTSGHAGRRGGSRDMSYVFTPSKILPRNTPESTGIPPDQFPKGLRSKSRVPFWNRALVLETGMQVVIKPRWSKKLFVPNWSQVDSGPNRVSTGANPPFYFTSKPTTFRPLKYRGNFATFWNSWWETNADRILDSSIEPIEAGIPKVIDAASRRFSRTRSRRNVAMFIKEGEQVAESLIEAELRRYDTGGL